MPVNKVPKNETEMLMQRISALEQRIKKFKASHRPTVPIYNFLDAPADAVEGQIAIMENAAGLGDLVLPRNMAFIGISGSGTQGTTLTHTIINESLAIGDGILVLCSAPSRPDATANFGQATSVTDSKGHTYSLIKTNLFEASPAVTNEGVRLRWFFGICTHAMTKSVDTITATWTGANVFDRVIVAWQIRHFGGAAAPSVLAATADNDTAVKAGTQVLLTSPAFTPTRDNSLEFNIVTTARPLATGMSFGGVVGYSGFLQVGGPGFSGSKQLYLYNQQTSGGNVYLVTGLTFVAYELDLGRLAAGVAVAPFNGIGQNYAGGAGWWKGSSMFLVG